MMVWGVPGGRLRDALYALEGIGMEVWGGSDGVVGVGKESEEGGRFCHDVVLFLTFDHIQTSPYFVFIFHA